MSDDGGWLRANVGTVVGWCLTVLAVASFAGTLYADVNHMASEVADNKKRLERYEERLRPVRCVKTCGRCAPSLQRLGGFC
jgi:hypothetical protein